MAQERKNLLLRLPPELWEAIQQLASQDLRSVNAEIEFLLRDAVQRRKGKAKKDDAG